MSAIGISGKNPYTIQNRKDSRKKKQTFKDSAFNFAVYLIPAAITLVLIFASYGYLKIFPFGKNTIASYDLHAQIVTFAEHFFDVIEGKASLFYTHSAVGGMDVFGAYTFSLLSPFTVILFMGGKGNAIFAVNILFAVKLTVIASVAVFFLRKMFKNLSKVSTVCLALLYTFSGWTATASTYIGWLDMMIYFPLMVLSFKHLLNGGNIRYFAICFAGVVASCYALGSFTLIYAFILISLYLFIVVPKNERKKAVTKTTLGFIAGVIIALPLLLPALWSFTKSTRQSSLMDSLIGRGMLTNFETKITYVLTDSVFLSFSIAFIILAKKRLRMNIFLICSLFITFLPVLIDEAAVIFNFGSYLSYAYRIGMLYTFMSFFVTAKFLNDMSGEKENLTNKFSVTAYSLNVILIIMTLAFTAMAVISASDSWCGYFAHSLGFNDGRRYVSEVYITLSILAAVLFPTILLTKLKLIKCKWLSLMIIPMMLFQVSTVGISIIGGNFQSTDNYSQVEELFEDVDEDMTFVRVKDGTNNFHTNWTMIPHYSSYAMFSSNADSLNFEAPIFFGYDYNGTNSIKSYRGTFFSDCVLGYKYVVRYSSAANTTAGRNLQLLKELKINDRQSIYLYQNGLALPDCFGIPYSSYEQNKTPTEKYNSFFDMLGGNEEYYANAEKENPLQKTYLAKSSSVVFTEGEGKHANGILQYKNTDDHIELWLKSPFSGTRILYTNFPEDADAMYSYDGVYWYYLRNVLYLGNYDATVRIKLGNSKYKDKEISVPFDCAVIQNIDLKPLHDTAEKNKADVTYTADGFKIKYSGDKDFLFLNSCSLEGYEITNNGEKIKAVENDLGLIVLPVKANSENNIIISYTSKYDSLSAYLILFAVVAVYILRILLRYYGKTVAKCEKAVFVLYVILFAVIAAYFIAFPVVASFANFYS